MSNYTFHLNILAIRETTKDAKKIKMIELDNFNRALNKILYSLIIDLKHLKKGSKLIELILKQYTFDELM